jgi:hypothetical protein
MKKYIKKLLNLIKKILNYFADKIKLNNLKKQYNLIKIKENNIYQECIFCFEELLSITNNYKCKFCSILFHEKCFLTYIKLYSINKCLQCNQ